MSALTKKLFREIKQLRGQLIAITIVIACGIANFVAFQSLYTSLDLTKNSFYDDYHFADVFLTAKRVPESVAETIAAIPGIQGVQTRVSVQVLLDLPNVTDPASGMITSVPDNG